MKRILPLLFLSILITLPLSAQNKQRPSINDLTWPYIDSLNFYGGIHKLLECDSTYYSNDNSLKSYMTQLFTLYSFSGQLDSAILIHNRAGTLTKPKKIDTTKLENHRVIDAKAYILNQADSRQVIIVNEAHHVPQHRHFVQGLLQGLYDKGYRYLSCETLIYDSLWLHPATKRSPSEIALRGFYSVEPNFTNLIREAQRIGYTVLGHESPKNSKNLSERDSLAALNLSEMLANPKPNGKLLMLVGYAHNSKTLPGTIRRHIETMYGITPLSVEQTVFCDHIDTDYDDAFYTNFSNQFHINTPSVLINSEGAIDNRGYKGSDIYVFSPRVSYHNGKPNWLLEGRKAIDLKIDRQPTIVRAYYADEAEKEGAYKSVIPVDQLVVEKLTKSSKYQLYLPKGKFLIYYFDEHGKVIKKYDQQVR